MRAVGATGPVVKLSRRALSLSDLFLLLLSVVLMGYPNGGPLVAEQPPRIPTGEVLREFRMKA